MTNHTLAVGETPRFLVRSIQTPSYAAHIADASGHPLCNCGLILALWQLQERPWPETVVCLCCRTLKTKPARSSAVPRKQRSAAPVADDAPHQVGRTSHAGLVLASITQQYRYLYLNSSHPPGWPRKR